MATVFNSSDNSEKFYWSALSQTDNQQKDCFPQEPIDWR